MANEEPTFVIPRRIDAYVRRLYVEYKRAGEETLAHILLNSSVRVDEGATYDNWDGGTYGHNITFLLSPEDLGHIPLGEQEALGKRLQEDFSLATRSVSNEFIAGVYFEMRDETDASTQSAGHPLAAPDMDPASLPFWEADRVRLFISHRDTQKVFAHRVASHLKALGVSSFVAHDTIEPDREWMLEIEKALKSMEAMLAIICDGFFESVWTNQEVGFALGKGIPVISMKISGSDPKGFIQTKQAIKATVDRPLPAAESVFTVLKGKVGLDERLRNAFVSAFIASDSWSAAESNFKRMTLLDGYGHADAERIIKAFEQNDQLHSSFFLTRGNRLANFLSSCTGKAFQVIKSRIVEIDNEIPF